MLAFLVPMLLTNTLQAVYMVIDMMWAGRLLGAKGVAVVATGMPVVFFLASLVSGITIGASILAGQAYGSKNHAMLTDIVSSSAIGVVGVSLAVSVAGVFLCGPHSQAHQHAGLAFRRRPRLPFPDHRQHGAGGPGTVVRGHDNGRGRLAHAVRGARHHAGA
jgi:Na+-driven multidrug efflux pump